MRKVLFLVITFIYASCLVSAAQNYLVYTVKGNIKSDNSVNVVPGMTLRADTRLSVPAESRIVILCESTKELHTIKTECSGSVKDLIKSTGNSTQQLTESYLAFIKQKIAGNDKVQETTYMQRTGTSYRDADSTLLNKLQVQE